MAVLVVTLVMLATFCSDFAIDSSPEYIAAVILHPTWFWRSELSVQAVTDISLLKDLHGPPRAAKMGTVEMNDPGQTYWIRNTIR